MVRIKRDPGIHITKSRFIEIWKSLSNTPLPKEFLDYFSRRPEKIPKITGHYIYLIKSNKIKLLLEPVLL